MEAPVGEVGGERAKGQNSTAHRKDGTLTIGIRNLERYSDRGGIRRKAADPCILTGGERIIRWKGKETMPRIRERHIRTGGGSDRIRCWELTKKGEQPKQEIAESAK